MNKTTSAIRRQCCSFERLIAVGLRRRDLRVGPRDGRLIAGKHRRLDMSRLPVGERRHLVGLGARGERQRHDKRKESGDEAVKRHDLRLRPMIVPAVLVIQAIGW